MNELMAGGGGARGAGGAARPRGAGGGPRGRGGGGGGRGAGAGAGRARGRGGRARRAGGEGGAGPAGRAGAGRRRRAAARPARRRRARRDARAGTPTGPVEMMLERRSLALSARPLADGAGAVLTFFDLTLHAGDYHAAAAGTTQSRGLVCRSICAPPSPINRASDAYNLYVFSQPQSHKTIIVVVNGRTSFTIYE